MFRFHRTRTHWNWNETLPELTSLILLEKVSNNGLHVLGLLFLSGEVWIIVKYHCRFVISQWRGLDIRRISSQFYYCPVAGFGYSSNIIAGFFISQWRGLGIRQISLQVYYFSVARSGYSLNIIACLLFPSGDVWIFVKYHCRFIIFQ